MTYFCKHFLSLMNAFGKLNKAGIEQGYQPMRFEA
jgi:hypothetical protein